MEKTDTDKILNSMGGWGLFQIFTYFSACCVVVFSVFPMSYIFVARNIKYRCQIYNCKEDQGVYNPQWLKNAVPYNGDTPSRCLYYKPSNNNTCTDFEENVTLTCDNFVFEKNQTTIVQDFDITCDENLWKLTIVGTINVIGEMLCLPLAGLFSDRFGRRTTIMICVFLSTLVGLVRSFSISYLMYVTLEFLDTALGSGMYSGAFILALEIIDSKRRNLGNTIICTSFALGQVLLGVTAWMTPSWRIMLRVVYTPGILIVFCLWFTPESIRWLISKNQIKKAWKIIKRASKLNGCSLNESIYHDLLKGVPCQDQGVKKDVSVITVFKTRKLLIRTLHCSFTWICCNFPYYGLTIQSVALSEDIYLNFIFTVLIEVPAYIATQKAINHFGRRKTVACSLLLGGISCITVEMVETKWLLLAAFLSGKFFITMGYTTLYIYTAEMFPTKSRHSIFAICSMCGRLGSLMAPQVPLLARIFKSLPMIIFSVMALTSGFLAFWFPETLNVELPDDIDEAVNIEENNY